MENRLGEIIDKDLSRTRTELDWFREKSKANKKEIEANKTDKKDHQGDKTIINNINQKYKAKGKENLNKGKNLSIHTPKNNSYFNKKDDNQD